MTLIRTWIDQLLPNLIWLGRDTNAIALKAAGNGLLELRNTADTTYQDFRARSLHLDSFLLTSRVPVTRRQCVLAGQLNASGQPSALSATGLTAQLTASASSPFVGSFAAGFDGLGGTIDYLGVAAANLTASLTANTTNYLYVERSSTGSLSLGRTSLAPIYSKLPPSSPAFDQHWFNTSSTANIATSSSLGMRMHTYSGGWVPIQRVFVGEMVTDGVGVTSTIPYAYQRRYQSPWTAVAAGTVPTFSHNLGIDLASAEASINFYARASAADLAIAPIMPLFNVGGSNYGGSPWLPFGRLTQGLNLGDGGIYFNGAAWASAAEVMCVINGGW